MRLLFISNLYPPIYVGGYELICQEIAQALIARGHDLSVLTSSYRARDVHDHEPHGGERRVYRRLQLRWDWTLPRPREMTWLRRNTLAVHWHNVRVARQVLDRERPDVALMWGGAQLGRGILSALEAQARLAYYLQDPWLARVLALQRQGWRTPKGAAWRLYRLALWALGVPRNAIGDGNRLVFNSHALKEQYERLGVDVGQARVIHNGISSKLFSLRPQHILSRRPDEPYRILFSGQVAPEKGVSTLIEAFGLTRAIPGLEQTRLSLAGSLRNAEYHAALLARIKYLNLEGAVDFLPTRPRAEMPQLYSEHDVLAFTSEWAEPFALTLLEGMAVGLPIVSSLTGGSAEIVRDGENALAFRAGDPTDLARKLAYILLHPQEASRLGLRAAQDVRQRFTFEEQVDNIEEYLLSLIQR